VTPSIHEDFGTFKKGFREIGSDRVLLNERTPKLGVDCSTRYDFMTFLSV